MNLQKLKYNWEALGQSDPYWAILTDPAKINNQWDLTDFFATGIREVQDIITYTSDLKNIPMGRALDFGCGVGRLSQALCQHFDQVIGVDIAQSMIDQAQTLNRFGGRCRYICNPHDHLHFIPSDHMDFIYSSITLQHMPTALAKKYITDLIRILKPNGVLAFRLPAKPPWPYRWLHTLIGRRGFNQIRKYKYGKRHVIEMYWTPKSTVLNWISRSQGTLLTTKSDHMVGHLWESHIYFVSKK